MEMSVYWKNSDKTGQSSAFGSDWKDGESSVNTDFNGVWHDHLLRSCERNPESSVFISSLDLALKF